MVVNVISWFGSQGRGGFETHKLVTWNNAVDFGYSMLYICLGPGF
jgi:hypothetical protein